MASAVPQPVGDPSREEYHRRWSSFSLDHTVYCVPVDQRERQRQEELDGILRELFHGGTVFVPFPPTRNANGEESESSPTVLDCGCGKGVWIEHLMDEFGGDCDVTGVDIFFGQPSDDDEDDDEENNDNGVEAVQEFIKKRWNLNARFRDDRGEDPLRPETFDLINSRLLAEGINTNRWQPYIRELKSMLKPGGWLQMVELQLLFQDSTGQLPDASNLSRWWQWYVHALEIMGKNPRIGRQLGQHLRDAGFDRVTDRSFDLPIGGWRPGQQSLGRDNLDNVRQMLTSLSLWPFLRKARPRMPPETYRALILGAQNELDNPRYRLYFKV